MTPVDVDKLESLLIQSQYNPQEIKFLCEGFRNGFKLGYEGPSNIKQYAPNLKLWVGSKLELWNKVMKEVKAKRYAGPFAEKPPFENFIQ